VFRFLGIPWNVNVLTLVAVTADLSSVQWSFRPDAGSFASHAAMLAFAYFYIRRDAGRSVRRAAARGAPREMEKKAWIKCPDGSVRPGKLIYSRMKNEDLFRDEDDHPSEHEIDRILDKISEKGLHSLTPEERRRLNRASRTRSRSS
jgi:hypothetical protein